MSGPGLSDCLAMPRSEIPASVGISYLCFAVDWCCATANTRSCCTYLLIVGECCSIPVTDPRSGLLHQQCTNDRGHFFGEDAVDAERLAELR